MSQSLWYIFSHVTKWRAWLVEVEYYTLDSGLSNIQADKGAWRIGRAPDCIASHVCVPGLDPADPVWVSSLFHPFQRD